MTTVKDLIQFLQSKPQDMPVVYKCYSEYSSLELWEIKCKNLCVSRPDGWVHEARPDTNTVEYLVFPGN